MNLQLKQFNLALSGAALLIAAGCGGGGGGTASAPLTTNVSTTVVDGALRNAVVCMDKNSNGKCDSDEVQGRTDIAGVVILAVPNADLGKYPFIALVGTDAVDADNGPVSVAYTLSAPADQVGVMSPLTTLVQQTIATTGASTADAAKSIQAATGITSSLFQDFTKTAPPTDGSPSAATVARLIVVTTQRQSTAIASTVGKMAIDNTVITQQDLDKAIQKKLLEMLPALVAASSEPAVTAATSAAARETALLVAANALVTNSGLAPPAVGTVVAINNQTASPTPEAPTPPSATLSLRDLNFTDAANYYLREFSASVAQNTPDANNNIKYVDRRIRSSAGNVAKWATQSNPARNADLHWSGSAWVNCALNFENLSGVRDAQGNSVYNFCDKLETGKSNRASFDVGGKAMADVYAQVRAAGYTNLTIANATALGSTTFPTGAALYYQSVTPLSNAYAYYPAGAHSLPSTSNVLSHYSSAVSAGGLASTQAAGTACKSPEAAGFGTRSTTLDAMIASNTGTPCIFAEGSFVYAGITYSSGPSNEWWGNSTVSLGKIGNVPLTTFPPTGYYSGNTLLRAAFAGGGNNPVTYYACKERFIDGAPRNCSVIGTGSYTITTLGDARVMTLSNPPAQAAPLNYNRLFVERGGFVYVGYQSKPIVTNTARLNTTATNALLTQLGMTPENPSTPLALTVGSYVGIWDIRDAATEVSTTSGFTIVIFADGSVSCQNKVTLPNVACSITITDTATGAFTYNDSTSTASGSFNFLAGTVSGVHHSLTGAMPDYNFVGGRR